MRRGPAHTAADLGERRGRRTEVGPQVQAGPEVPAALHTAGPREQEARVVPAHRLAVQQARQPQEREAQAVHRREARQPQEREAQAVLAHRREAQAVPGAREARQRLVPEACLVRAAVCLVPIPGSAVGQACRHS